jgi:glycogen synthase
MRIAFVTFEYPPAILGGAGVYAFHLAQELAKAGHTVVVFTPGTQESSPKNAGTANPEIRKIPAPPSLPFRALRFWLALPGAIHAAEKAGPFDIIHFNGLSYGFIRKKLGRCPRVLTVHHLVKDTQVSVKSTFIERIRGIQGENGFILPLVEKRAVHAADAIIAVSNYTRSRITAWYGIPLPSIDVVYNGVDPQHLFRPEELAEICSHFGIKTHPVILFVGKVDDPRKGIGVLLAAFEQVLTSMDATLVVAGGGDLTGAQDLAGPVVDKVIFTGFIDDQTLKGFYRICDLYVSTSRIEGFGLTVLEAFAAGKPVIATDAGAFPELIRNGKNGFLVACDDPDALAEKITYLLKRPSLMESMGEENARTVEGRFGWNTCAGSVGDIYLRCVRSHGRH